MPTKRIELFDDISMWGWNGQRMADALRDAEGFDVELHINSPGGDVFEGFAIANVLKMHKGKKTAIVAGLCASAATFPAMVCDSVQMHPLSMLMIHNPWGGAAGDAEELEGKAAVLRSIEDMMVGLYSKKSGASEDKVRAWLDAETWMKPAEAKANGLCDEILDPAEPMDAKAAAGLPRYLAKFKGAPAAPDLPAPAPKTPTAGKPAATPPRIITVDRKQLVTALAACGALFNSLAQQASDSPDQDLRTLGAALLQEGVLPAASALIMPLAVADGVEQESADMAKEMPRVYAEACKISGFKTGLAGWLDAAAANSKKAAGVVAANVDVLVEAEIQKGIKATKILPSEAARWRALIASGDRTIADLRNNIATALPAGTATSGDETKGKSTADDAAKAVVSDDVAELTNFDL